MISSRILSNGILLLLSSRQKGVGNKSSSLQFSIMGAGRMIGEATRARSMWAAPLTEGKVAHRPFCPCSPLERGSINLGGLIRLEPHWWYISGCVYPLYCRMIYRGNIEKWPPSSQPSSHLSPLFLLRRQIRRYIIYGRPHWATSRLFGGINKNRCQHPVLLSLPPSSPQRSLRTALVRSRFNVDRG